jgi:hypothetical protein
VLGIDKQPVVAAVRELFRYRGAVGIQEQSHFRLACAQLFFEFGSGEFFYGHVWLLDADLRLRYFV